MVEDPGSATRSSPEEAGPSLAVERLLRLVCTSLNVPAAFLAVRRDRLRVLARRGLDLPADGSLPPAMEAACGAATSPLDPPIVVGAHTLDAVATAPFAWRNDAAWLCAVHGRSWSEADAARLADFAGLASAALACDREDELVNHASQLVALSPDGILVHVDGTVVLANASAARLTGAASTDDLVGRPLDQLLAPPYLKSVEARIASPTAAAPSSMVLERLCRLDGAQVDVEVAELPYLYHDDPAVLLVIRDVTERLRAEAAIRRSEAQLRLLVERLPAVVWATDDKLRVVSLYGAPRVSGGHQPEALVGQPVSALLGPESEAGLSAHHRALAGATSNFDVSWAGRTFGARVQALQEAGGPVIGILGVAIDLTERLHLEAREREVHVLGGIARLAGGVAHEMNNVLGAIMGYAASIEGEPVPPEVRHRIQRIGDAARRGSGLTRRLLGFAREGVYERACFAVNDLVEALGEHLRSEAPPNVVVRVRTGPIPLWTEGDAGQLREALHALAVNGIEAMPYGGTLTLEAAAGPSAAGMGPMVYLEVRDTGVGMDEQLRNHAMEPFFTTKPFGAGEGLGLPMAYGIVARHGGRLVLESAPGRGTVARVSLPAVVPPAHVPPPPPPRPRATARPKTRRALLVDDDEWVREASGALLTAAGWQVSSAASGPAALRLFEAAPDLFSFVLLDMRMPGMDGAQVLDRLLAVDPDVRVVLCSGYTRDQIGPTLFSRGRVGFLEKPFDLAQLREQLRIIGVDAVDEVREPVGADSG